MCLFPSPTPSPLLPSPPLPSPPLPHQAEASASSSRLQGSGDLERLREIFFDIQELKDDQQQRGWAVHDDQQAIVELLEELLQILVGRSEGGRVWGVGRVWAGGCGEWEE